MRFVFFIFIISGQAWTTLRYQETDRVPFCDCGEQRDPEWSLWKGCEQNCSNQPVYQYRSRGCEGKIRVFTYERGIIEDCYDSDRLGFAWGKEKGLYIQRQERTCDWIPECGKLKQSKIF